MSIVFDQRTDQARGRWPAFVAQCGDFVAEAHEGSLDVMPVGVVMARDFLIVSFRHFPTVSADEHLKRSHFAGANQRLLEYGSEHVSASRGAM
ncbi:MAG: hypothetical protein AUH43_21540 [Acidobacteria bacterium 13_1_40CM_65_14]|nr:MAG: hypothetical protein AUH43_21540 [Acidobacteria bacterium 13_1_40CM_65_14]